MRRIAAALVALALVVAPACGDNDAGGDREADEEHSFGATTTAPSSEASGATTTLAAPPARPNCTPVPPASTTPTPTYELPPLPDGTRWFSDSTAEGVREWEAAVPASLPEVQETVIASWRDAGWEELFGEAEPGIEAEGRFLKDGNEVSVRVRNVYCDTTWTHVVFSVRA